MQGGCMSVSSLGGIGGTAFTPIVNPPEVAILGLSKASIQPVWNGQEFVPRLMLPLSLSYDHRVVDGAEAARFSQKLQSYLRSEEHTSELQSRPHLVCRLLLEKKKKRCNSSK